LLSVANGTRWVDAIGNQRTCGRVVSQLVHVMLPGSGAITMTFVSFILALREIRPSWLRSGRVRTAAWNSGTAATYQDRAAHGKENRRQVFT
jgi:hypothetical protein